MEIGEPCLHTCLSRPDPPTECIRDSAGRPPQPILYLIQSQTDLRRFAFDHFKIRDYLRHFGSMLIMLIFKSHDSFVEPASKDILRYEISDLLAVRVTQVQKRAPRVRDHHRIQSELIWRGIR